MKKINLLALVLFFSCADSEKSSEAMTSQISNPIFLEMFNEYSTIINDYHMIIDSDDFNDISKIESITKRASLWAESGIKKLRKLIYL